MSKPRWLLLHKVAKAAGKMNVPINLERKNKGPKNQMMAYMMKRVLLTTGVVKLQPILSLPIWLPGLR